MADVEKNWWEDKTIQIPKGLLIPGASGEEVAVYAHMKSFGAEARSSLKALAHRLGWTEARTRQHQQSLWQKQWIVLLREGENKEPRQWWMCSNAGEQPPQELVTRVSKNATLPPQAMIFPQGAENPAPEKSIPKANKSPQANNNFSDQPNNGDPPKQVGKGRPAGQDEFWRFAQPTFKAITGQALSWPRTPTFQKQMKDGLETHGVEELCRRWDNYLVDPYAQSRSLLGFFYDLDKWINKRQKLTGAPNGNTRTFHQPASDWKPSGNEAPKTA